MTITADSNTIFHAKKISRSRWGFEFHPNLTEVERVRCVVEFNYKRGTVFVTTAENRDLKAPGDDYYEWDAIVEAGKSYMVGSDVPTDSFLKSHSSYIPADHWLAFAVDWAFKNPPQRLIVPKPSGQPLHYEVYKRGDYVEIALPHHGQGGEKHWAVHADSPRKKLLINVD